VENMAVHARANASRLACTLAAARRARRIALVDLAVAVVILAVAVAVVTGLLARARSSACSGSAIVAAAHSSGSACVAARSGVFLPGWATPVADRPAGPVVTAACGLAAALIRAAAVFGGLAARSVRRATACSEPQRKREQHYRFPRGIACDHAERPSRSRRPM